MAELQHTDVQMEDEYDEEADSDFMSTGEVSGDDSSSSSEPDQAEDNARPRKRRKTEKQPPTEDLGELDSGDEVTIKEHKRTKRKAQRKGQDADDQSGDESEGWRARTRAMRDREKEEKKRNKLASLKASTIDVDTLWTEMNRPEASPPPPPVEDDSVDINKVESSPTKDARKGGFSADKENIPDSVEEMITIKRTYQFAGQMHTEEKLVPKSSAEARLWMAQQASKPQARDAEGRIVLRPLRKISRFDPNLNSIDAFKGNWTALTDGKKAPTGPKLNVVEKSKMDWAVHVDAEGLKEELDVHAKAKEGYLNRMDFLRDVEHRKEEEARAARRR